MMDIAELVSGYRRFLRTEYPKEAARYEALANLGQAPRSMIIACCDSRVDPSRIFCAAPGELFVVRNVANLVPPFEEAGRYHGTSAAVEFAVEVLHVEHILVLGHARCGGVRSFVDSTFAGRKQVGFIGNWVSLLAPAWAAVQPTYDKPHPALCADLERAGIVQSIANLRSFPFVERAVAEGRLRLHGAYFDIANGTLLALDTSTSAFSPVR